MKKNFKLLLAITVIFTALSFSDKTLAESTYIEGTLCPAAPSSDYSSICGIVKSSIPMESVTDIGETYMVAGKGMEGVSVYLYECDNSSSSCKNNGYIVHPFASTSTNAEGRFHLLMRKLDNLAPMKKLKTSASEDPEDQYENVNVVVQSKRRYLIFVCGIQFAGIQVLPSYIDLPNLIQEVKCPDFLSYKAPPNKFKLPTTDLANQTGTGDVLLDYPGGILPGQIGYENHLTKQVYDLDKGPIQKLNFNMRLEEADPRFLKNTADDFLEEVNIATGGNILFADEGSEENGSWFYLDCLKKYEGKEMEKFCMGYKSIGEAVGQIANYATQQTTPNTNSHEQLIVDYEKKLYADSEFVIQNKLPNIPPRNSILFYKELPLRQDLTAFVQDPTAVASFNATQYSNCIGDVFLRKDYTEKDSQYPACDKFKECNNMYNPTGYSNRYTTVGPAQALQNPVIAKIEYDQIIDKSKPVCVMDPSDKNAKPIKISDIQPPWDTDSSKYSLDSSYWSNEFIYYYGQNNYTAKYGTHFYGTNDSYPTALNSTGINKIMFAASQEAGISYQYAYNGGTSVLFSNDAKNPNMSLLAGIDLSSNVSSTGENYAPTDWVSNPSNNELVNKYIMNGVQILSSNGGRTMDLPKYSETNNLKKELIDVKPEQDVDYRKNQFGGNQDHYPFQDLNVSLFDLLRKGIEKALTKVTPDMAMDYATFQGHSVSKNGEKINILISVPEGTDADVEIVNVDDYIKVNEEKIKDYIESINNLDDGTRTPTSSIYMTTAAKNRHEQLSRSGSNSSISDSTLIASDLYDSILSTLYGDGELNFSEQKEKINQIIEFFRNQKTANFILSLFGLGGEIDNKSFLDRINGDNLGKPIDMIDDLKTMFPISEENFLEKFPLPIAPGRIGGTHLLPSDWSLGKNYACYPWNSMTLNQSCKTSQVESADLISRTCRVDKCTRTTTNITCECTRTEGNNGWNYKVSCSDQKMKLAVNISDQECEETSGTSTIGIPLASSTDDIRRLVCAQKQTTCLGEIETKDGELIASSKKEQEECIKDTYSSDINKKRDDMVANSNNNYCGYDNFANQPRYVTEVDITQSVNATITTLAPTEISNAGVGTPSCLVSRAGPYMCAGILEKDSELELKSEVLLPTDPSEPVDSVSLADNKLRQSFEAPSCNKLTYSTAAFVSADSSIRDLEGGDISKLKDTTGLGGVNGSLLREMFRTPRSNYRSFNPVYYHCSSDIFGGSGGWTCNTNKAPNPEVVDIYSLPTKSECSLKPSPTCNALVFGGGWDKEVGGVRPVCQKYSPTYTSNYYQSNGFSQAFLKIVNAAASRFDVHAAAILAYMEAIGNLRKYSYYWSVSGESDLYDVSAPWYGTFDDCDDMNLADQGPMDWRLFWFSATVLQDGGSAEALREISRGRENTASRCNFLDSVYTAAAALSKFSVGCGNSWESYIEGLSTLTFGSDRVGAYETGVASLYSTSGNSYKIFQSCK